MDKILITGGSGLLGSNIAKISTSQFEVYSIYNKNKVNIKNVNFLNVDLTETNNLEKIKKIKPNLIINCAALTDVDICEKNPKEAYKQNVQTSSNIANVAKDIGASLIHISTDAVFNGDDGNYSEKDNPQPINVYGKTKLMSEIEVNKIYPDSCIVRTNIYGWNIRDKFSLAEWIIDTLNRNMTLKGFHDVFFAPIFVNDLTNILFELNKINYSGIIHIGSADCISKLSFAYLIAEIFGLDEKLINPISIDEFKFRTLRPKNSCLNVNRAKKILKEPIIPVKNGLQNMKQIFDIGYVKELKNG